MTLPIPKLDDRSFKDLAEEARSLIPRYSKEWTNFNPSDPGITLLELFAWLSEMMIFRIDQIPKDHILRYLELIGIKQEESESLNATISRAVNYISSQLRAVNSGDYESLALDAMEKLHPELQGRVICVTDRNLELVKQSKEKPGHISLIIIPSSLVGNYCCIVGRPRKALLNQLKKELYQSRILTHRLHLVGPHFQNISIKAEIIPEPGSDWSRVLVEAKQKLSAFFNPVFGGPELKGWPIGRYLYRSEIFEILEGVNEVDYTRSVTINGSATEKYVPIGKFDFIKINSEITEGVR